MRYYFPGISLNVESAVPRAERLLTEVKIKSVQLLPVLTLAERELCDNMDVVPSSSNKTIPTQASVATFIDTIADDTRRADAKILSKLMRTASGKKAILWGASIIGFGSYRYRHPSGREGDMPLASFSPRKSATVLYLTTDFAAAKTLLSKLGKFTAGGSCLYIKKLADVDVKVLAELIRQSIDARRQLNRP